MLRALAILAVVVLFALVALRTRASVDPLGPAPVGAVDGADPQRAELVAPTHGDVNEAAAAGRSVPAEVAARSTAAAAGGKEASEPLFPVAGIVVDQRGRPLPGVEVQYLSLAIRHEGFVSSNEATARLLQFNTSNTVTIELPDIRLPEATDSSGAFLFEDTDRRAGGHLRFGEGYLLDGWVEAIVDPEADIQVLRLPDLEQHDSTWEFWLVPSTGFAPVPLAGIEVEFLGGESSVARQMPPASEREIEDTERGTRVLQRGLPPGTFRFVFDLAHGLEQRVEVTVEKPGTEGQTTAIVTQFPGAEILDQESGPAADGSLPWVDGSTGLPTWLPALRRRVGEHGSDLFFAETLRIGHGPVKAAELTLVLRSNNGSGRNDTINLEHTGARTFAWSARVSEFTRTWQTARTSTLHLDLSRLPNRGSEPTDLLPHLEDGLLDVVIQDDTTVEHLSIRVVR